MVADMLDVTMYITMLVQKLGWQREAVQPMLQRRMSQR